MNTDILYENEREKTAAERVIAAFSIQNINGEMDELISEIIKYAIKLDTKLEELGLPKRYLDRVSTLSENRTITLDEDLENLDFRDKEVVEDLISRINTRFKLVEDNDKKLKYIEANTDLEDLDLKKEIELSKLNREYFE